jgi:hypothetical protein
MQEPIRRGAKDPGVVRATAGLAAYLRELVLSARRPVRDCANYDTQVWLADLPEGVDRPSAAPGLCWLSAICVPETPPSAAQDARGVEGQGG